MKKTKIVALSLILALIINMVMPLFKVVAESEYTISFQVEGEHTISEDGGHLKIDDQYVDLQDLEGNVIGEVNVVNSTKGSITVTNGTVGKLNYNSADKFTLYNTVGHVEYNMETELSSNTVFLVEDCNTNNNNPDPSEGNDINTNTIANITISAGVGTYGENRAYDDETEVYINGSMWNHSNTISYNSAEEDTTVTFTFETLWINRYYEDIVINGTTYTVSDYLDFDDKTAWLVANHGTQLLAFDIPNVTKADSYNIVVKHGENLGKKYFATFLWTADPAQAGGHDYIGNAKLEFVKAVYEVGGTTYTVTEQDLEGKLKREGEHKNARSNDGFLNYGITADVDYDDGSLTLPGGAEVTMRVVPDYGYQVTSVNGDGEFTTTDSGVSEFTLTVEEGTAGYFQATVEKVDNEVTPKSEKVKTGEITLGDNAATDIGNGTVRLSVEDIELTSDKIADFEAQAGDYKITNYLDINLNKVLYRGSSDNVWSEQIHSLTDKALITLQLEDNIDASNIVIVHNINDGEEFEIIPIESYDAETNTISFYTDSFSNYAIATKTVEETPAEETTDTSSNPSTGDNIVMFVSIFAIAALGACIAIKFIKK